MNFLLINSNENDAFAAMYFNEELDIVKCSEFSDDNQKPGRSPDKLVNCLVKLRSKYDFTQINAIAVTIGPGSFTGIRVGLALAKGIAGGLNVPLIPVNNFDLIYSMVNNKLHGTVYYVMIPGKIPEFYYSIFRSGIQENTGSLNIEEIMKIPDKNPVLVGNFGNESILKHSYFTYINLTNSDLNEPEALLKLTKQFFAEGKLVSAEKAEPLYIKDFQIKNRDGKLT